jgi:hypothetical protein
MVALVLVGLTIFTPVASLEILARVKASWT